MIQTFVKVFVTKTLRFRAQIYSREHLSDVENIPLEQYEVSVLGQSWKGGRGREHAERILNRVNSILYTLQLQRDALAAEIVLDKEAKEAVRTGKMPC